MPHQVMSEDQLDFHIDQASKSLKPPEFIMLRTSTATDGRIKMKFKTKKRLYVFITDTSSAVRLESKYSKVRTA